jgi:hypothetical protein
MNATSAAFLFSLALTAGPFGVAQARAAELLRDDATGLSIQPPDGYEAKKAEGDARYAVVYAVQKKGEVDTGCKVAFQPIQSTLPAEEKLNQDEINSLTRQKKWIDLIRATLAIRYNVATVEPFEQQGLAGAAVVADFQGAEGEPKEAEVRSYLVVFDTPKGRTTIVCVGEKASFEGRRKEFEAIARSVAPPR